MIKPKVRIYSAIKTVVDKHDFYRLLILGCPKNEYDPESKMIAAAIRREGPVTSRGLARIIQHIFHHQFEAWVDPMLQLRAYTPLAREIWDSLPPACRRV